MKTYLVRIDNPQVRDVLVGTFEKVGEPRAIVKTVLVTTDRPVADIQNIPGVTSVQENGPIHMAYVQYDPPNWALPVVSNTPGQYEYEKTGKDVDIYILDSGVKENHVEFGGRVTTIFSQDGFPTAPGESHGTIAASQAAGTTCGVAKQANIFNAKMRVNDSMQVLKAIDRVFEHHLNKTNDNPSILNMSFGSTNLEYLKEETLDLVNKGIICVASAHNFAQEGSTAPACHHHVISVGATDKNNNLAYFSNYGPDVDILAPGYANRAADVNGYDNDHYGYYYGTSFSCPIVAGVLALIAEGKSVRNITDVEKVTSILLNYADTSKTLSKPGTTNRLAYSLLPTAQSKIFLDKDETNFVVGNSGTYVYGQFGYETIVILPGVVGVSINGNIEEVFFQGRFSEYTFKQRMNNLLVYKNGLLIAIISVQQSGVRIVFGRMYQVTLTAGKMKIDGEEL